MKRRHFSVLFAEKVASLDSVVQHFVYLAVIICKREKKIWARSNEIFSKPTTHVRYKVQESPFSLLMVTKVMSVIYLFNYKIMIIIMIALIPIQGC